MTTSSKVIYAQSSDIKSRSYLEYRRDMKKKAIAELEFLPFLKDVLAAHHNDESLTVKKYGGDAELWFGTGANVTQQPDYQAEWGTQSFLYEFQYAEQTQKLTHFDFKVSKVGIKKKGKRIPHKDREFFYVAKPDEAYAFVTPDWIMKNGKEGPVPAWGSRPAYRVPRAKLMKEMVTDNTEISDIITMIDNKNLLLSYQHEFLSLEAERLSRCLQNVVDAEELFKIVPGTLSNFYEVCYLLDKIDKIPDNAGVWLVYLASFFKKDITAMQLAQFMFALDFLYFKLTAVSDNEKQSLIDTIGKVAEFINNYPFDKGLFTKDPKNPPLEETRQILFSINLLEDLTQDIAVKVDDSVKKIERIFERVPNVSEVAAQIKENSNTPSVD